jgi:hypothetical protein
VATQLLLTRRTSNISSRLLGAGMAWRSVPHELESSPARFIPPRVGLDHSILVFPVKTMNPKWIPAFSIHSAPREVHIGRKFLSQHEFSVIVFAATGISAHSRSAARAHVTFAVEWSKKGKKTILHKSC